MSSERSRSQLILTSNLTATVVVGRLYLCETAGPSAVTFHTMKTLANRLAGRRATAPPGGETSRPCDSPARPSLRRSQRELCEL